VSAASLPALRESYERGRYYWNRRTAEGIERATRVFEGLLRRDADYAPAHAALADCYAVMPDYGMAPAPEALPKAEASARRALELDPRLAEAHASLGYIRLRAAWDWNGADRALRRAIELDPAYPSAHQWYAIWLGARGRHDVAIAEIRRARELDPGSVVIQANVGRLLYHARRYDAALAELEEAAAMDPGLGVIPGVVAFVQAQRGDFAAALEAAQRFEALMRWNVSVPRAYVAAMRGDRPALAGLLPALAEEAERRGSGAYFLAEVHAALHERDAALAWLEKAERTRDALLIHAAVDPALDPLRGDPRLVRLLERLGLGAE
jgi:tetratricopeptide (TPR) repeat protein